MEKHWKFWWQLVEDKILWTFVGAAMNENNLDF